MTRTASSRFRNALLVATCSLCITEANSANHLNNAHLNAAELKWIAQNPVVRVVLDPHSQPGGFSASDHIHGLTSGYLKAISVKSGIKFELVPYAGTSDTLNKLKNKQIDVLPDTLQRLKGTEIAKNLLVSRTFYLASTVVITHDNDGLILDLNALNNKTIAVRNGDGYIKSIKSLYPNIQILPTQTLEEALLAVLNNRADAVLGLDAALFPYLRRKYASTLDVSGVISELPGNFVLGVRHDLPLLHSIINKTLASLTPKDMDLIDAQSLNSADYGTPPIGALVQYYKIQILIVLCIILTIALFAYLAHRDRRRALRSERAQAMFLAVASHEIRSPMHAVLASLELMQTTNLSSEQQRLSDLAANGARTLLRLLDEILDLSKLEAGQLALDLTREDIVKVVRRAVELQQLRARMKGVSLALNVATPMPGEFLIDASRVSQIAHNLVSNAIKFTNEGDVTVSIAAFPPATLEHNSIETTPWSMHLTVEDTGIGIAKERQGGLFRPYAQADKSTGKLYGGTGLGLIICRELVALMGGDISLASEPDKGTIVEVRWPVFLAEARAKNVELEDARAGSIPLSMNGVAPNVLLVEDTPVNAAVILAQLKELNCIATLAENGQTAIAILKRDTFDLILMDCNLPGQDGYETTRLWRTIEAEQKIDRTPILAISASTETHHADRCFAAGMDGILKKPLMLQKLREAIAVWCETEITTSSEISKSESHLISDVVSSFSPEVLDSDLDNLEIAFEQKNLDDVIHFTHRLTGAALTLGYEEFANATHILECILREEMNVSSPPVINAYRKMRQLRKLIKPE